MDRRKRFCSHDSVLPFIKWASDVGGQWSTHSYVFLGCFFFSEVMEIPACVWNLFPGTKNVPIAEHTSLVCHSKIASRFAGHTRYFVALPLMSLVEPSNLLKEVISDDACPLTAQERSHGSATGRLMSFCLLVISPQKPGLSLFKADLTHCEAWTGRLPYPRKLCSFKAWSYLKLVNNVQLMVPHPCSANLCLSSNAIWQLSRGW